MPLRLPPADIYRQPFVEPLGHLTMQAAHADNELIRLCARVPSEGSALQMAEEEAAHRLRNWNDDAVRFVGERINLIDDAHQLDRAKEAVSRYTALRQKRHRVIHDAVEVSLQEVDAGYVVQPVAIEFRRSGGATTMEFNPVTPDSVAELACEFYEVQQEFKSIAT